ncbi:Haloacid dehalogenase superfamily, subfamily IA, variant 2 with 3rd motif like haloacid dehalogenase/haloacid dehalogenase superfamily, subfamily IA, variant 3 with third motif having DD or ED [Modicisalibacter ilicicola DSM 19980]|uniref:Haloacid dehalogenase superfamily, subfamily IA, variant 2 with 3rd motif like haloacid dehalogenase/haloacid dehalogenase superfamily, subfamily IA, variant 3 with third motif having DD or ED n=1 Tax=Modicisalibacter ilicicola DSM 19980 TaxID=1121942 RepID=A0A1M5AGL1_9GAMM|nr:HAD family phosphatase [Halomonas ilicicola]SHF29267.1 Haloacid dehalogenase superfamily, subfamily IA, variant 2 with 3rd motif like haloacid dehalogenase/haloacid dehalogenase superfamily, subfamily IA, variant 3 with third motif having DD or ED [Halomonas ilicicola DSM 19980]
MIDVLFFDLDGTLSDTHGLARATWLEVLRPHGIDVDFEFYQENIRGLPHDEALENILPRLEERERSDLLDTQDSYYRNRLSATGPLPGLIPFLDRAGEKGYRLALVSNAPREIADEILHALGLEGQFDAKVFAEDAGVTKPDPAVYRLALERLGVAPDQGLAFEDSPKGVTAAIDAGLTVIAMATTHHPAELRDAGASLVVGDFVDAALDDMLERPEPLG